MCHLISVAVTVEHFHYSTSYLLGKLLFALCPHFVEYTKLFPVPEEYEYNNNNVILPKSI